LAARSILAGAADAEPVVGVFPTYRTDAALPHAARSGLPSALRGTPAGAWARASRSTTRRRRTRHEGARITAPYGRRRATVTGAAGGPKNSLLPSANVTAGMRERSAETRAPGEDRHVSPTFMVTSRFQPVR
jgi:hypothetical protein